MIATGLCLPASRADTTNYKAVSGDERARTPNIDALKVCPGVLLFGLVVLGRVDLFGEEVTDETALWFTRQGEFWIGIGRIREACPTVSLHPHIGGWCADHKLPYIQYIFRGS